MVRIDNFTTFFHIWLEDLQSKHVITTTKRDNMLGDTIFRIQIDDINIGNEDDTCPRQQISDYEKD